MNDLGPWIAQVVGAALVVGGAFVPTSSNAQTPGSLSQLAGLDACVSEDGSGPCTDGTALEGAHSVTLSKNGKSVYVTGSVADSVAVFQRNK